MTATTRAALILLVCLTACAGPCAPANTAEHRKLLARLHDARPAGRIVAIRELADGADRETITAIAQSAFDGQATEDVRAEIARVLGKSNVPESVDLIGALLRNRDGSVGPGDEHDSGRAAAVMALSGKQGERAAGYIISAYETGGPLTRAAVSHASADTFRRAVAAEANDWRKEVASRRKDSHAQIRAAALTEQGRDSTEPMVAELSARLVDPDPQTEVAAAAGLFNAQAVDQVPALITSLRSPAPIVVGAVAEALHGLDAASSVDALAEALKKADGETAGRILDALEDFPLTPSALASLCDVAKNADDSSIASRAASLAGKTCALPQPIPDDAASAGIRLVELTAQGVSDPEAVKRARDLLDDKDAAIAAAAAEYLGLFGDKSDAEKLLGAARAQLNRIVEERVKREVEEKERNTPLPKPQLPGMGGALFNIQRQQEEEERKKPPPKLNALRKMLEDRKQAEAPVSVEDRPGAIAFIEQAAKAGAHWGGDFDELSREFLADPDAAIRRITPSVADAAGPAGEELRARIRTDADQDLRLQMALLDYASQRPGALDVLTKMVPKLEGPDRFRVSAELSGAGAPAKSIMLELLAGNDSSSPIAAGALASLPGEDIDKALIASMNASVPVGRYSALAALSGRQGPSINAALADAAVHPSVDLREAATRALLKRHACEVAERLAPLSADYSGPVRSAVARLGKACAKGK